MSLHHRLLLLCALLGPLALPAQEPERPNVVIVFTDDQGYGDVGCQGARGFETPNMDRLAREGLRFTDFYAAQAVCSASRAGLLTGCYPNRIGIRGALGPWSKVGIHEDEETLAELLKRGGYATAIFGKWHLGYQPRFLPLRHGFDEYLGLPYSNDMWPIHYDGRPSRRKGGYAPLPLIDGAETVEIIDSLADQATLTTRYTERAVRFIDRHADRPFFLYVPHSMPHVPLGVSRKFAGKSRQGAFGDVMMEVDWSLGRILEALARNGIDERTLVVFTSDNGPWLNYGNHAGSSGPFREGKGTSWEGGQRVPCFMRWPARIRPGRVCREIAATIDLLPTITRLAGVPGPRRRIDGVDLGPLLDGVDGARPRDRFLYYYTARSRDQLQAVRLGRWKLHLPHRYRSYLGAPAGRDGFPGPYAYSRTGTQLYDLEADPGERRDVAARHPEVVARLLELAESARDDLGDVDREGRGVRPPGRMP